MDPLSIKIREELIGNEDNWSRVMTEDKTAIDKAKLAIWCSFFGNFLIFGRLLGCYTTIIRRRDIGCCLRLVDGIKRAAIKYLPIRFY